MRHISTAPSLVASLAFGLLVTSAGAAHADSFTPEQRQEIIGIVREALKTDPSILSDAILSLRAQAEKTQAGDSAVAVQHNQALLSGTSGDFIAGNPRGNVTLVVFYDPRCPYCRKTLPDLDALVAGDHKLRLVEKLIPILGPNSLLEAKAIAAAGRQNQYASFQHALMGDPGSPGMDRIQALARQQGLDLARLDQDMADPTLATRLSADVSLAQALGISGTPSFVVGGKVIQGEIGLDELRQAVSRARAG
jgi:protein-disulfide isomerase